MIAYKAFRNLDIIEVSATSELSSMFISERFILLAAIVVVD